MRWMRNSFFGLYVGLAVMGPIMGARADAILSMIPEAESTRTELVVVPPRPPYSLADRSSPGEITGIPDSSMPSQSVSIGKPDAQSGEVRAETPVMESEKKVEVYKFPVSGYRKGTEIKTHWGLGERGGTDLFGRRGASILSVSGGQVIHAGYNETGGYSVTIKDSNGRMYYYAHLDQTPIVKRGASVKAGQKIGILGDSGNAKGTGPHLHIGIGEEIKRGGGVSGGCGLNFDAVSFLQSILDGS
jgi:murein DD-endopeptidase MepM/ murein hydrolase activator NlpD